MYNVHIIHYVNCNVCNMYICICIQYIIYNMYNICICAYNTYTYIHIIHVHTLCVCIIYIYISILCQLS